MREIRTSGLMSGVGKRDDARRQHPRPTSTLPPVIPRTCYVSPWRALKPMRNPTTLTESLQYSDSGELSRASASDRYPPSIILAIEAADR